MPKLPCRCGYVHNLSQIPDDGFQVFPDWATDKLLYTRDTRPEDWEVAELRRTALARLYSCPNCEAVMWNRAMDGQYRIYVPSHGPIRIYADLDDRDRLGGIRLRHPRTLADIAARHLLMRPGLPVVVHDDQQEIYAQLEYALADEQVELALDDADDGVPEAMVARPLDEVGPGAERA